MIDAVIKLIRDYPDLWGRHRVALALAERGITVSEATISRMLPVARKRIEIERDRIVRERRSRRSRQVAAMVRRDKRDARKEEEVQQWLEQNITCDLTPEEAFQRIGATLSKTAWKLKAGWTCLGKVEISPRAMRNSMTQQRRFAKEFEEYKGV